MEDTREHNFCGCVPAKPYMVSYIGTGRNVEQITSYGYKKSNVNILLDISYSC